uniref:Thioredoxin domain-containing protein n=1 Tax=Chromera velia CCMP2878 TaxID=1169474 RepID=A0A0G4FV49_9ALVE|mmetsp:Transcript_33136/g.65791  ORF Transcript_33136/g.65791 Transcript_33136/m.65791 type:complete len:240 (-) Transcript_33136:181-900(-)|eukprot:Cvel_18826.t1-p1 / transcript=Cvel_18826.t1 / gene=Cvel_18826 / organism=Chromera_velia_CCMP2878 / gene_product=Nucleoredoxin, putative / transcript_product=Nucleoredoxin, putative / location=Cvel_scaffold1581:39215-42184(-) / protein_length=239 / sequence_SO=supercontig / SO=protein_coding / is_pseudo=false
MLQILKRLLFVIIAVEQNPVSQQSVFPNRKMSSVPGGVAAAAAAGARSKASFLFPEGALRDGSGTVVPSSSLRGKSVGLYFSDSMCPMCTAFDPVMRKFREDNQGKVELVFVSSDRNEAMFEAHSQQLPGFLAVRYEDPLRESLKERYRVWCGWESSKFGRDRRSGVPGIVVVREDGEEIRFLATEHERAAALAQWAFEDPAFLFGPPMQANLNAQAGLSSSEQGEASQADKPDKGTEL